MADEIISQAEFARRLGVTPAAVNHAIISKRISKTAEGKINFTTEYKKWFRYRDTSKMNPHNASHLMTGEDDGSIPALSNAKLAKETYTARLKKLEYDRESGKLIEKEGVLSAVQDFCRWVRDSIITIPDRVSAEEAARFIDYIKPLLVKKCGKKIADEIILELDLVELERIVHQSWVKESREVLTGLKESKIKV